MEFQNLSDLNHYQLCSLLEYVAEITSIKVLIHVGKIRPYLNKSQAERKYGRKLIEEWISRGWITVRKDGDLSAPLRINRLELESIARANDFIRHYLTNNNLWTATY
ncbi:MULTISPECIES: hypothetical protein [Sphingobacterium]|uniref:hypothetical protein n=1 Tax=Sphingobacterium TaxID=28453 RepID=UPI00257BD6A7|nr:MULTISPECIES: hypothetical protein [Sphingobacterium]